MAVEFGMPIVSTLPWFIDPQRIADVLETDTIETSGLVGHACEAETSVMMRLTPGLVRAELVNSAYRPTPGIQYRRGFSRFWSFSELQPTTGVMGDPRPSTPEKGEKLLAILAEMVAKGICDEEMWRVPDGVWAPGRGLGNTNGASYEGR